MTALGRKTRPLKLQPKGLVVDDDPVWQSTFARYLTDAGLVTVRASSRAEAESLLSREFFHIALIDMSLVGDDNRDGLHVLRKIYGELREGTSGLLLTAYGTPEEGAEANDLGAFHVFNKRRLDYTAVMETVKRGLAAAADALGQYHVGLNLIAGPGIQEDKQLHESRIVMTLGRGVEAVDRLAVSLFRGLYPALRAIQSPVATIDDARRTVSGTYWSKMLGAPFFVTIGTARIIEEEVNRALEGADTRRDDALQELLRVEEHGDLGGAVFQATSPAFSAFDQRSDPSFRPIRTGPRRK